MIKKKAGNIINIISTITDRAINMQAAYASSKIWLDRLDKTTAKELGKFILEQMRYHPGAYKH